MKNYPQPIGSPDGVNAWAHEELLDSRYHPTAAKAMDAFDTLLDNLPVPSSTLAELKPLDPLDYLSASPDTSVRQEPISSTSSPACKDTNAFITYTEPVSTTTIFPIKQEPPTIGIPQDIDDIATIIGSAISENNPLMGGLSDSLDPLNASDLDIEAWIESISSVKSEPIDSLIHSSISPSSMSPTLQVQHPTTTIIDYDSNSNLSHVANQNTPTSSPMLQSLLAAGTNNNNYIQGLVTESSYPKPEVSMPILQARLTQGIKEGHSVLKADPMFNRTYYSNNKDALPHSTDPSDPTAYTVSTTDEFLGRPAYLDKTQMVSPESSDSKIGLDYPDVKGKNRNRISKSTKIPIRTEGTKDKPVHHCTVCNRGFLNKSNIKVHLRTHTGEKPFKCETCNKAFRQKAHLLKHYQIHRRG